MKTAELWSIGDEADVAWYFQHGLGAFGKSTFGGQLERAEALAFDSHGYRVETERSVEQRSASCRARRIAANLPLFVYGEGEVDPSAIPADDLGPDRSITARPILKRESEESGYTPDDNVLRKMARVSRALNVMSAFGYDVLCRYYLFGGNWDEVRRDEHKLTEALQASFKELRKYGRLLELFPLTVTGKRIIEVAANREQRRRRRGDTERPVFVVADEVVDQLKWPDATRGRMLIDAKEEAMRLIASARLEYSLGASGTGRRKHEAQNIVT
jgi:hypothetical protein